MKLPKPPHPSTRPFDKRRPIGNLKKLSTPKSTFEVRFSIAGVSSLILTVLGPAEAPRLMLRINWIAGGFWGATVCGKKAVVSSGETAGASQMAVAPMLFFVDSKLVYTVQPYPSGGNCGLGTWGWQCLKPVADPQILLPQYLLPKGGFSALELTGSVQFVGDKKTSEYAPYDFSAQEAVPADAIDQVALEVGTIQQFKGANFWNLKAVPYTLSFHVSL